LTYVLPSVKYGGAEIGMVRLLRELDPDDFDVTVVTLLDTSRNLLSKLPDHVETVLFSVLKPYSYGRGLAVWRRLGSTDVLVCSLFHPTVVGTVLGRIRGVPRILTWQHSVAYTGQVPGLRKILATHAHRAADRVLADSDAVQQMLTECGLACESVSVVPLAAVDTDRFEPPPEPRKGPTGPIQVVTVGRMVPAKGHADLLAVADRLGEEFEFNIVGDGPLRDRLEARAPENVVFHGTVDNDDLPSVLRKMDVYFQPSHREGLCISVVEAMAVGLPIVGSDVGGIPESVVDGTNGYLAPPGDVEGFSRSIRQLGRDAARRADFGRRSRERAVERFSAEVAAERFRAAVEPEEPVRPEISKSR
jgi:glycosyltransferase involved in cell wall biosynthesis